MILNENQYRITRSLISKFSKAIKSFESGLEYPRARTVSLESLQLQGLQREHERLVTQVTEYKKNRSADPKRILVKTEAGLGAALIKARLAHHLTQASLSKKLGICRSELERYESQKYLGANRKTVELATSILGVKIRYSRSEPAIIKAQKSTVIEISDFPFNEMYKRGWFAEFSGSRKDAKAAAPTLISRLLGTEFSATPAFHRKNTVKGKESDPNALAAWQARVKNLVRLNPPTLPFTLKKDMWADWMAGLRQLVVHKNGIRLAKNYLVDHGIGFAVEKQLPSTYLDGMACIHEDGYPMIALTTRYDRVDNFWFVLFHELGHVALHLDTPNSKGRTFLDDMEGKADKFEIEADQFATENLIPAKAWQCCPARLYPNTANILSSAKELNTSPAIIAGWIRKEKNNFMMFNNLVGHGCVRSALA